MPFWTRVLRWSVVKVPGAEDKKRAARELRFEAEEAGGVNHGHPVAAGTRWANLAVIKAFIDGNGWELYDTSSCPRTQRLGIRGKRDVHWMADLLVEDPRDSVRPGDFLLFNDSINYQEDLGRWGPHDFIAPTFVPRHLAECSSEKVYYFTDVDEVVTEVTGGTRYRERVYDFSHDKVVFQNTTWKQIAVTGCFAWVVSFVRCPVQGVTDREVIVGICEAKLRFPLWVYRRFLELEYPVGLQRLSSVTREGPFLLMRHRVDGRDYVDIMRLGTVPDCVTVPADVLALWKHKALEGSEKVLHATVCNWFRVYREFVDSDPKKIDMVVSYLRVPTQPEFAAVNFTPIRHAGYHECVARGELVAAPIVEPGVVPTFGREADEECISERVEKVANLNAELPKDLKGALRVTVCLLIRHSARIEPTSIEEVLEKARNDQQRRKWLRACRDADPAQVALHVKPFQKREVYGKVTAPRNISDVTSAHALNMGVFSSALLPLYQESEHILVGQNSLGVGKVLSNMVDRTGFVPGTKYTLEQIKGGPWVVFGDDGLVKIGDKWYKTDFSRMDGSCPSVIRDVLIDCGKRAFTEEHARKFAEYVKQEEGLTIVTNSGVTYNSGSSILSGSKNTTLLGTTANAAVIVCALVTGRSLEETAALFGMSLKIEPCDGGLSILSRVYPSPRETALSHAEIVRALEKIPVTVGTSLADRVNGYLATDAHVPLLGEYLRALKRVYGLEAWTGKDLRNLASRDRDMFWRHMDGVQKVRVSDREKELLKESVARSLGCEVDDVDRVAGCLDRARSPEDIALCMLGWLPRKAHDPSVYRE